ncbi:MULTISPECIES: BTAD domain-containing putative transcriptional regulator [Streptacidiphilus]|uniref:BTAD domain-containing putative transcriptional regulator n=1 Tax=Streptacidiphilus cavernicola TaxID=3342716 RepID=A0ABV6UZR8_9ACTN|nr:BTAD domain-containing putative transcriptional regulator [Streptacidiphilus jeojiense]
MEFRLLGPLRIGPTAAGVPIGAGKSRALLAALLLDANSTVPIDRLVEAMWQGRPPASAAASLYNHVMRLRRILEPQLGDRIRAVTPGYLIRVEPGELDTDVFSALCADGRRLAADGQWARSSSALTAALDLWRGSPLADVPGLDRWQPRLQQLLELRQQALEGRVEADLQQGRHHEIIGELRALTVEQPLHEAFHRQLMLALYRADRRAEALGVFQALRRTLVDELGVEPSAPLQELQRRILSTDPSPEPGPGPALDATTSAGTPPPGGHHLRQLPADTRLFTGRTRELDRLLTLAESTAATVVVTAIDGAAGIGKSALAIHAAHRLRPHFPDGQLFIDLHGHTDGLAPLDAGQALDGLLRSLGVPPQLIPQELGERAAFYRDRLAGTRTLIILDNAAGTAQVRPLVPGTPGCLVMVTSRRHLTGLDDAHSLTLDVLPEPDAHALLLKAAGPGRIADGHPAVDELTALCGYLPLAVRITASRLRHHRALHVQDVVGQLRDENARLDVLQDDDRSLSAVFDLSYTALPAAEQHMFRRLALVPGPDFDARAAAALADTDRHTAARLLESLLDHSLLIQRSADRYRLHDLLRLYARTRCADDPAADRDAALTRLLNHYQRTAAAADRHLARHTRPGTAPLHPAATRDLPDRTAALAWMRAERANLLACAAHAATTDQPAYLVELTASLAAFLQQEGPWQQAAELHQAAAETAHRHHAALGEANALSDQGRVRYLLGDYPAADDFQQRALTIYQDLGDLLGEANALHELGRLRHLTSDSPAAATALQEQALALYRKLCEPLGEANALHELGRVRLIEGDFPAAAALLEQALTIHQDLGSRFGEAYVQWELGRLRNATGEYPAAAALLRQALTTYGDLGSRFGEANSYYELGRVQYSTGDYPTANALQLRALELFREFGSRLGEAYALHELGRVRCVTGEPGTAAGLLLRALARFEALGDRQGEANAVHDLARARQLTGDQEAAADLLARALTLFRELGDRQGEAEVLTSTGALAAETAGPEEALARYRQALEIARVIHSPVDEARALDGSAACLERLGEHDAALADLRLAAALYRRIGSAEAAPAAARLARLESKSGG